MCLPLETLRCKCDKALGQVSRVDDYELNVGAIAQCQRRTRLSELLRQISGCFFRKARLIY